jgi:hypothetical protein
MKVCPASTIKLSTGPREVSNNLRVSKVNQSKGRSSFDEFEGLHEIDRPIEGL